MLIIEISCHCFNAVAVLHGLIDVFRKIAFVLGLAFRTDFNTGLMCGDHDFHRRNIKYLTLFYARYFNVF